jgi:hypothetical protein
MPNPSGQITILPTKTITTALTGFVTDVFRFGNAFPKVITVYATFVYGSSGTTVKAWLQTSLDDGATWIDVMNFAFLLASLNKVAQVNNFVAQASVLTPTDGTLADNTIVNGILGPRLRLKITTTGTYAGDTTLALTAMIR